MLRLHSLALLAAVPLLAPHGSAQIQIQTLGAVDPRISRCDGVSDDGAVAAVQLLPGLAARTESDGFVPFDSLATVTNIAAVRVSRDGTHVFGLPNANGGEVVRWDVATGNVLVLPITAARSVVALNDDGTVALGTTGSWFDYRAYLWSETGGVQYIEDPNGISLIPTDMTPDGSVVVGRTNVTAQVDRAFRWTQAQGVQILQDVPGSVGQSVRVSDDGQVVAGTYLTTTTPRQVFRWTPAQGRQDLGTLTGGRTTEVLFLSGDGTTIVGADFGALNSDRLSYRWTQATGFTLISSIPRFIPNGVSFDGETVCGNDVASFFAPVAHRWTLAHGLEALPTLTPTATMTQALGMSSDGRVIYGRAGSEFDPDYYAVVWREDGSMGAPVCDPAVANSTGAPGRLRVTGSNLVENDALVLEGSSLPPSVMGFAVASRDVGFVANPGGSQGNLCLSGQIGRFVAPGQVWQTNAAGEFTLAISPTSLPTPITSVAATFDESWSFQAWYRDANPAATSNFTNAVSVRFY